VHSPNNPRLKQKLSFKLAMITQLQEAKYLQRNNKEVEKDLAETIKRHNKQ
jgi:hypothetical protein